MLIWSEDEAIDFFAQNPGEYFWFKSENNWWREKVSTEWEIIWVPSDLFEGHYGLFSPVRMPGTDDAYRWDDILPFKVEHIARKE